MSLEVLIYLAKKNDGKAWKRLHELYNKKIKGILYKYGAPEVMQEEDLLQEVWVKIYENIHQLRDYNAFPGWMKVIAVNVAIQYRKSIVKEMYTYNFIDRGSRFSGCSSTREEAILSALRRSMKKNKLMNGMNELSRLGYELEEGRESTPPDLIEATLEAKEALESLSVEDKYFQALLRSASGESYKDIAKDYNISMPALQVGIHRCREKLKKDRIVS